MSKERKIQDSELKKVSGGTDPGSGFQDGSGGTGSGSLDNSRTGSGGGTGNTGMGSTGGSTGGAQEWSD